MLSVMFLVVDAPSKGGSADHLPWPFPPKRQCAAVLRAHGARSWFSAASFSFHARCLTRRQRTIFDAFTNALLLIFLYAGRSRPLGFCVLHLPVMFLLVDVM